MGRQHPERMGWIPYGELPQDYMHDELLQVRHIPTGDLVCGWSGRGHRHYLLPLAWPDPESGAVRIVWVDKSTMRQFGRAARRVGGAIASRGLRGFVRKLIGTAFRAFLGKKGLL